MRKIEIRSERERNSEGVRESERVRNSGRERVRERKWYKQTGHKGGREG